jgi:hypothetical protein
VSSAQQKPSPPSLSFIRSRLRPDRKVTPDGMASHLRQTRQCRSVAAASHVPLMCVCFDSMQDMTTDGLSTA